MPEVYLAQPVVHEAFVSAAGSVGSFDACQALMPPTRSLTFVLPAAASKLAAIAER